MAVTDLPTEIWDKICEYLDKPSLHKLSLSNNYFRSDAVKILFKAISIHADQAAQLQHMLKRTAYIEHVRVLEVYHRLRPTLRDDASSPNYINSTFEYPNDVYLKHEWPSYYVGDYPPREVYVIPENANTQEPSWGLVASLLQSLPALNDLIWTCQQQVPACLLRILHDDKRFATCRLHIRNFRLRSLATTKAVDPHEMELVQSPNLYSVWFRLDRDDVYNNDLRLPEVVSYATRSLAPNLRIVRLRQQIATLMTPAFGAFHDYSQFANATRLLESVIPRSRERIGRLQKLQFTGSRGGDVPLDNDQIAGWMDCTDFSALQTLILDAYVRSEVLTTLTSCDFASLTTLSLELVIESHMATTPEEKDQRADKTSLPAREFLCTVPPLKALRLTGEFNHSYLRDVLAYHGQTLRTLQLVPAGYSPHRLSLPPSEVACIGHCCQALRSLRIQMHRSGGDANEAAAYSSLGSIAPLQNLDTTLDASDYAALRNDEGILPPDPDPGPPYAVVLAPPREHFDYFDREYAGFEQCGDLLDPLRGHFKDMFVNAALDRDLARSIYAKLAGAKPPRGIPFDRVELRSVGGGSFGQGQVLSAVAKLINELQGRWAIQKDWTAGGEFTVTELKHDYPVVGTNSNRARIIGDDSDDDMDDSCGQDLDPRVEVIFRRLWPAKADGSDWRKDWHSSPLV